MNISLKCLEVNLLFMPFSANVLKDQKIKRYFNTHYCVDISKFGYLFVYLAFSN